MRIEFFNYNIKIIGGKKESGRIFMFLFLLYFNIKDNYKE